MQRENAHHKLQQILKRELEEAQTLCEILDKEHQILQGKPDDIIAIAAVKQRQLDTLEAAGRDRETFLKQLGYHTDLEGVAGCISWCDRENRLHSLWQQYRDCLNECQNHNRVNGMIIESHRRRLRSSLSILHGENPQDTGYGSDGESLQRSNGRSFGKV